MNKGNYKDMREELARVDWKGSLAGKTVEQQWQEFLGVIRETQQKFIPKRRKHAEGRMRHPWLMREVKDSIKAKEKTYKVARIGGKSEDWEPFKSEQRTSKKAIWGEKMKYECKLPRKIKEYSKSFFQYIKYFFNI